VVNSNYNERKNSTNLRTKCNIIKFAVLVVTSFLVLALISSSSYRFDAVGKIHRSSIDCIPTPGTNIVDCCYQETDTETGKSVGIYCATCYDDGNGNLSCGAYEKVESIKPPNGGEVFPKEIAPPPSGVAPPPSTQTCPENMALDASGNCAPLTQGPTDQQGTTEPPTKTPPTIDQNEKPQVKEKNKDTNSEK
jgi:hypothetical protein